MNSEKTLPKVWNEIANIKTNSENTYVKKSGDTMTGGLTVTRVIVKSSDMGSNNPQYQLMLNNELLGYFGVNTEGVYFTNVKLNKSISLMNNGNSEIPASNLATNSKEVITAINEVYNILTGYQPTNPKYKSLSVSRDENNSSPALTYSEQVVS